MTTRPRLFGPTLPRKSHLPRLRVTFSVTRYATETDTVGSDAAPAKLALYVVFLEGATEAVNAPAPSVVAGGSGVNMASPAGCAESATLWPASALAPCARVPESVTCVPKTMRGADAASVSAITAGCVV